MEEESNQITSEETFKLFQQMKSLYETMNKIQGLAVEASSPPPSPVTETPEQSSSEVVSAEENTTEE